MNTCCTWTESTVYKIKNKWSSDIISMEMQSILTYIRIAEENCRDDGVRDEWETILKIVFFLDRM